MAGNFDERWQRNMVYQPPVEGDKPAALDPKKLAKTVATLQHAVAAALVEKHHEVWPLDQDVEYRVIQRNGKVKISFSLPFSKEPGYKDA